MAGLEKPIPTSVVGGRRKDIPNSGDLLARVKIYGRGQGEETASYLMRLEHKKYGEKRKQSQEDKARE